MFTMKAGKPSPIGPETYRPISFSSLLLKALKRLIDLYLGSNTDRSLLSRSQNAYIKGKSVGRALHAATGFVEVNLARSEYTLSLGQCKFRTGQNSLRDIHAPGFLLRFITHMLGNRLIRSNLGGCSIDRCATRGRPQGDTIPSLNIPVIIGGTLTHGRPNGVVDILTPGVAASWKRLLPFRRRCL